MTFEIETSSRQKEKLLEKALFYGLARLIPNKRVLNSLDVTLTTRKVLKEVDGVVEIIDEEKARPRNFLVQVSTPASLSIPKLLKTTFHELVHVKQYATGELQYVSDTVHMWRGKRYKNIEDMDRYWDLPWEVEAHGMEMGLAVRFARQYGYESAPWYKGLWR